MTFYLNYSARFAKTNKSKYLQRLRSDYRGFGVTLHYLNYLWMAKTLLLLLGWEICGYDLKFIMLT